MKLIDVASSLLTCGLCIAGGMAIGARITGEVMTDSYCYAGLRVEVPAWPVTVGHTNMSPHFVLEQEGVFVPLVRTDDGLLVAGVLFPPCQ